MKFIVYIFLFFTTIPLFSQTTKIYGIVKDKTTGEGLPFVKIQFFDSKISTLSDSIGNYVLESYYATDSIRFVYDGYEGRTFKITKDVSQEINCQLGEREIGG